MTTVHDDMVDKLREFGVTPMEHDCVECLEPDCDCGGNGDACNGCTECGLDDDEMEMEEQNELL